MKRLAASIVVSLFLLVAPLGCDKKSDSSLPITQMQIGNETFNLEIATSSKDQEIGLMHRDHLDTDHGMIFVFPDEQVRDFWNHEVHFSLDLIFLNSAGDVVSIKLLQAWNERSVSSDVPAKYAIELNAGTADKIGLKVGAHLTVPPDALNPPPQPATTQTSWLNPVEYRRDCPC